MTARVADNNIAKYCSTAQAPQKLRCGSEVAHFRFCTLKYHWAAFQAQSKSSKNHAAACNVTMARIHESGLTLILD